MTRIYLANVGANTSHRFASPIFEDGAFEFLPIPESPRLDSPRAVRYRDLRPHDSRRDLSRYVPPRLWDRACHNDPEFDTFTYGDECDDHARAVGLRGLQPGDVLLFLAGLEHWAGDERTGQYGFFLIGGLRIDWVLPRVTQEPAGRDRRAVRSERPRRARALHRFLGRFLGVRRIGRVAQVRAGGPGNQGYLREGVQDRLGQSLEWAPDRSDLQTIGSYTRTCRCVLDTSDPEQQRRAEALREWIATWDPEGAAVIPGA